MTANILQPIAYTAWLIAHEAINEINQYLSIHEARATLARPHNYQRWHLFFCIMLLRVTESSIKKNQPQSIMNSPT